MSTWFARYGFGVREGASGNPTHHMQDMLKKGHTPIHISPLFLHPLRAHCILLSAPMVRGVRVLRQSPERIEKC